MDIIDCSGLWTVTLGVGGLFDCATAAFVPEVYDSLWEAPSYASELVTEAYAADWGTPDYASEFETEEYAADWEPCP